MITELNISYPTARKEHNMFRTHLELAGDGTFSNKR
jgi:hypothetical protein